jgi:hypothetical protein
VAAAFEQPQLPVSFSPSWKSRPPPSFSKRALRLGGSGSPVFFPEHPTPSYIDVPARLAIGALLRYNKIIVFNL